MYCHGMWQFTSKVQLPWYPWIVYSMRMHSSGHLDSLSCLVLFFLVDFVAYPRVNQSPASAYKCAIALRLGQYYHDNYYCPVNYYHDIALWCVSGGGQLEPCRLQNSNQLIHPKLGSMEYWMASLVCNYGHTYIQPLDFTLVLLCTCGP